MLTGPSASGKTTSAHCIARALQQQGTPAQVISLDNFFKGAEFYPRLPDGTLDYENPDTLDLPLIKQCLRVGAVHTGFQNIHLRLLLCLSNVGVQAALLCGVWLHIEAHQLADHLLEEHGDGISGERAVGVYPMVRLPCL